MRLTDTCLTNGCENDAPTGEIHCSSCRSWITKFGFRGEQLATQLRG